MPRHSPCALISLIFVEFGIRSVPFPAAACGFRRILHSTAPFLLSNSNPLRWALNLVRNTTRGLARLPLSIINLLEKSIIGSLIQIRIMQALSSEVLFS